MSAQAQAEIAKFKDDWKPFNVPPRPGEVFAARRRRELFPMLFIVRADGRIAYYNDPATIMGAAREVFTDWLYVGEA